MKNKQQLLISGLTYEILKEIQKTVNKNLPLKNILQEVENNCLNIGILQDSIYMHYLKEIATQMDRLRTLLALTKRELKKFFTDKHLLKEIEKEFFKGGAK